MTSEILSAIDGALHDWETSNDAMRWSPRLAEVKQNAVNGAPPATLVSSLPPGLSLTGPGGPWIPLTGASIVLDRPAPCGTALADLGRAIGEAFRSLLEWAKHVFHSLSLLLFPEQHQRCHTCHPQRKPKPLAVNGHEYQRRLRNRRRRRH